MTELLTAAQMRAIERAAIESGAVTGLELMERAGRGTVEAILAEWPELAKGERRAVVLCGPGNNGGDGFVVARLLRERGWAVEVFLYGHPEKLPPDARVNCERWLEAGTVGNLLDDYNKRPTWGGTEVVIDAIFGIGLDRPLVGLEQVVFNLEDAVGLTRDGVQPDPVHFIVPLPRVVAVDVPTGLNADSGEPVPHSSGATCYPSAHLTITFHRPKLGHYLSEGPAICGRLRVVGIGLESPRPLSAAERPAGVPPLTKKASPEIVRLVQQPRRLAKSQGHKYRHGHALVLSGGPGRGGAARMAARGALRIGAGLVTLGCPPAALQENASRVDAVMTRSVKGSEGLAATLADERLNALALGPGLGGGEGTRALVEVALRARRATVLDADALTAFADDPPALFALLHPACVLTPHGGEFARLFPGIAERLQAPAETGPAFSKVDATREAAARAGCVVLHKGPDTVIAAPDGRAALNSAAYECSAPWLATAGAGDVLTGFIAGLMARGLAPLEAAEAAAWLHVECALAFGPGLIAEDLPDQLPAVFRRLGL